MADEPARIEFERSGGFAGIPVRASVSADALDPRERAGLEALLAREQAGPAARAGAPDRFQYDVTVIAGGRRHRVRLGERELDESLRALIDRLERDAAPEAGRPES
jgi:hypothetical protein